MVRDASGVRESLGRWQGKSMYVQGTEYYMHTDIHVSKVRLALVPPSTNALDRLAQS